MLASQSSIIFDNPATSEELVPDHFVECPLIWISVMISHHESTVMDFEGVYKGGEVRWSLHCI